MDRYAVLQDARNGIYPVLVNIPTGDLNEKTYVSAIYPFGWEEYAGVNKFGRFITVENNDTVRSLVIEILLLRDVLKRVLNATDRTLSSCVYDYGKVPSDIEAIYRSDSIRIIPDSRIEKILKS